METETNQCVLQTETTPLIENAPQIDINTETIINVYHNRNYTTNRCNYLKLVTVHDKQKLQH